MTMVMMTLPLLQTVMIITEIMLVTITLTTIQKL